MSAIRRFRVLAPLQLRDFRLLWTGMVASLLGDGVFLVAMAWQVYLISNAPSALAMVGFATSLPQVVLLLAGGVVADRFERRRVIVIADLARGVAIGSLGGLALAGSLTLPVMIALVAVYGSATAFFGPAFDAIVPVIVPAARLTQANALDQFMRPAALRLAGPALGGVVVAAVGAGAGFAIDAASFAFSALCVARMAPLARPAPEAPEAADEAEAGDERVTLAAVREGFRFVRGHVWLWGTFVGATVSYLLFMGPAEVLLPFVVKNTMHAGAGALGIVFAAGGVGALLAAAIAAHRGMPRRHITWMYVTWSAATLSIAGYGAARYSWQLAVACFAFNGLEAAGTVWWATMKGRLVPGELLGRVSSFDWFISISLVPLSYALTAPVAAALGARATLVLVGLLGALTTISPLFLRGMRDVERSGLALDRGIVLAPVRAVGAAPVGVQLLQ